MSPQEGPTALIRLLADHEQAVGELYRVYARRLREMEAFWMALAAEEAVHLRLLARLARQVAEGVATFAPKRFSRESLQSSLAHVRAQVQRAQTEPISERQALAMAVDIEDAMIERRFFEVFDGDSVETCAILNALASGAFAHRDRVREALSSL